MDPATNEAFVWLIWSILTFVIRKNVIYNLIISSEPVLAQLILSSLVVFAPGLCEAILSLNPPCFEFWTNLPTECASRFGVYALVFVKEGFPYKIYIGVGTEAIGGVEERWDDYDKKTKLPMFVEHAFNQGYRIEHKGLLCWAPIPAVGTQFRVRVLFYAMEAAFTIVFWAIASRYKDEAGVKFCPWPLHSMEYVGLCSHSAFNECPRGIQEGLTEEELEAKELAQEAYRRSPEYLESIKVSTAQSKALILATQQYSCKLCGTDFISPSQLEIHEASEKHKNAVLGVTRKLKQPHIKDWEKENIRLRKYVCNLCPNTKPFGSQTKLNTHYRTQKHLKAKAAALTSPTS